MYPRSIIDPTVLQWILDMLEARLALETNSTSKNNQTGSVTDINPTIVPGEHTKFSEYLKLVMNKDDKYYRSYSGF